MKTNGKNTKINMCIKNERKKYNNKGEKKTNKKEI